MRNLLYSAMIFWTVPYVACADEMRPLAEVASEAAAPYASARCGGYYQAMMDWVGYNRMGNEAWEAADAARLNMIMLSALIAQKTNGGTFEHQAELTARDVRNIANLYLARMEANYASVGQAFGEDDLIQSDMALCKSFAETLQ